MPISAAEVAELRREGEALDLDSADTTLKTVTEVVAYTYHGLRALGMDEAEALDQIELLARAVRLDMQELREAHSTLSALQYPPLLLKLLTRLARLAKPPAITRARTSAVPS